MAGVTRKVLCSRGKMQGNRCLQVFELLAETVVSRVDRLIDIRLVRICLSIWLVDIWDWSGLPAITVRSAPCHARRGITARPDRLGIVKFNNLPVVRIHAESPLNGVHIGAQR